LKSVPVTVIGYIGDCNYEDITQIYWR